MIRDKKTYRFLIVEDNPGDFLIVEDLLAERISNPVIVQAMNYKQAAGILLDDAGFDAILLDLSLPDKSGQELVTAMLELSVSCCPIIILTGYQDIEFSIKSISRGIMDYLFKDDLTGAVLYKSIIYSIERKKNISELKESHKQYSNLFNLSPQPMWVFDAVTLRFVQVNKATIDLYGYSEEEFLNMTLPDIKQKEDVAGTIESIKNQKPGDPLFRDTVKHHKKTGELIEVEIYATGIIINDKMFRSVIAIDVTEKKLYEHKIIKAIIKTQEDERYEIGGELHDNVCQILATSLMSLGMMKDSLPTEKIRFYDQCYQYIHLALDDIRSLSHRLAPAFLNNSTLEEAMRRLLNSVNPENKYDMKLRFCGVVQNHSLSLEIQLTLYRILQEQLRNILNYAKAGAITVEVGIRDNVLHMKVSDDGVGFDPDCVKGGIGLANIRRRTELFSGKLNITSSPGRGCSLTVDIPLPVAV